MDAWLIQLKYDPIPPLLGCGIVPILYFVEKDLLGKKKNVDELWYLSEPQRIIRRQLPNGSWKYPGRLRDVRDQEGYNQYETLKQLGFLVEQYNFNKTHPSIQKAADYLFSHQTSSGEFARGIYGTQYAPTYSAAISEILIKAGYENEPAVVRSLDWLLSMRQNDGGWAIPLRTIGAGYYTTVHSPKIIEPLRSKPFSHLLTGMVLRALVAHPDFRNRSETKKAATLLSSRFFKRDKYADRNTPEFWTRFSFPFLFTDILTSLDSLSQMDFDMNDPNVQKAILWFVDHQGKDGLWKVKALRGKSSSRPDLWINLAICRVLKRLFV
jgi:hypothetical protein